jgi:hypothetical protein
MLDNGASLRVGRTGCRVKWQQAGQLKCGGWVASNGRPACMIVRAIRLETGRSTLTIMKVRRMGRKQRATDLSSHPTASIATRATILRRARSASSGQTASCLVGNSPMYPGEQSYSLTTDHSRCADGGGTYLMNGKQTRSLCATPAASSPSEPMHMPREVKNIVLCIDL